MNNGCELSYITKNVHTNIASHLMIFFISKLIFFFFLSEKN